MEFKEKTVILTGASSGIGYALTKLIAAEKCKLALLSRRNEITDKLADELKSTGSEIISMNCDVSVKEEVVEVFGKIKEMFGHIDIAILNAGVSLSSRAESYDTKKLEQTMAINVLGLSYCIEALLPDFINRRNGIIAGVSSLADGRGYPKSGFYCASKAAATRLLESLAIEVKKFNIKVLTIKPGFVKTPMTDKNDFVMPFLMDVQKGAKIIFNGIKKEKRIIQFPLPTVLGAKILRIIPDVLFERIIRNI